LSLPTKVWPIDSLQAFNLYILGLLGMASARCLPYQRPWSVIASVWLILERSWVWYLQGMVLSPDLWDHGSAGWCWIQPTVTLVWFLVIWDLFALHPESSSGSSALPEKNPSQQTPNRLEAIPLKKLLEVVSKPQILGSIDLGDNIPGIFSGFNKLKKVQILG
jgi:hypothetical protein